LIFNQLEIILFFEVIFLVRYSSLLDFFEEIAPPHLESDWDNSGPQVTPVQDIDKMLIGLDPTGDLIDHGLSVHADLLLTHHPLIFSPLERLDRKTLTGEKIFRLIQNDLGLVSIHTPFDQAEKGLSEGLAERLNLKSLKPLTNPEAEKLYKLEVFVPKQEETSVVKALTEAGAGKLDNYEDSYYRWEVEGSFRPLEYARPQRGQKGETERTEEVKLEFLVRARVKDRALSALHRSHPYEEPGYSLVKTERTESGSGLGRIGRWESPRDIQEVKSLVAEALEITERDISVAGSLTTPVTWSATSPGSGGAAVQPTLNSGVELLITGELDYHERLEAVEKGLTVIEVGHYNSEKVFIRWIRDLLRERFPADELKLELHEEGRDLE